MVIGNKRTVCIFILTNSSKLYNFILSRIFVYDNELRFSCCVVLLRPVKLLVLILHKTYTSFYVQPILIFRFMDQIIVNRMIRVLYMLTDNVNHTVDEIADKIEASSRTVYRYLNTFKSAGLKVICRYRSVYMIERESVSWDDSKRKSGKPGKKTLEQGIVLQRPGQDLRTPDGTYGMIEQFKEKGVMNEMPYLQRCVANIDLLVRASVEKRKVLLRKYECNERNRYCDYIIEPFDFPFYYNFVWAYDCRMKRNILLRSTRMNEVQVLDENWENEEQHRRRYLDAWGYCSQYAHHIILRMTLKVKNLITEAYPMTMLDVVEDENSKNGKLWILDTKVCDYRGITESIMGLLDEVEILEGEEFREYVRKRRRELMSAEI